MPALVSLCVVLSVATASAQAPRPWLIRVEAGSTDIHRLERRGALVGVRMARGWLDDRFRLDIGAAGSNADRGFFVADAGVELRPLGATYRVAPFVVAAVGPMIERYGHGLTPRVGGGIEVRLGNRHAVRVSAYRGTHGDFARGPHAVLVGYSRRF